MTSRRLALRAAGEGKARAARLAACVLGPSAARAPQLPAARPAAPRAPPPATGAARGILPRRAARGGGEGLGRRGPRRRGEGTLRTGLGNLAALAPRPERASSNPVLMPIHLRAAVSAVLLSAPPHRPAPRGPGASEPSHLPDGEGEFGEIGEPGCSEMGALRAEDPWLSSIPSDPGASLGTTSIRGPGKRGARTFPPPSTSPAVPQG